MSAKTFNVYLFWTFSLLAKRVINDYRIIDCLIPPFSRYLNKKKLFVFFRLYPSPLSIKFFFLNGSALLFCSVVKQDWLIINKYDILDAEHISKIYKRQIYIKTVV